MRDLKFIQNLEVYTSSVTHKELSQEAARLKPPALNGGKFVGILPEPLRWLWAYISRTQKNLEERINKIDLEMLSKNTKEKNAALDDEIQASIQEIRNLYDFFWIATCSELNLQNNHNFSVCKDWAIHYADPICIGSRDGHPEEGISLSIHFIDISDLFKNHN
ncbi:MAG: hypothetical protein WC793_00710 [Candidatus Paceibacterota bacterium]|jgi:hypothetical protein